MTTAPFNLREDSRAALLGALHQALAAVPPSPQPASDHLLTIVSAALPDRQRRHLERRLSDCGEIATFELRLLTGVGASVCGWQEHQEIEGGALRRALEVLREDLLALNGLPAIPGVATWLMLDLLATCAHFWPHNDIVARVADALNSETLSAFDAACLAAAAAAAVQAASAPPVWTSAHDEW